MRSVLTLLLAAIFGVGLGLSSAWVALEAEVGFNRTEIGPWSGSARLGGVLADPYTRAQLVRTGELPLGGGEGVTFIARHDDDGRRLSANCVYVVETPPPPARWWTLTVYSPEGRLLENPAGRFGFTSREVMREPDGTSRITLARRARPGDWLPVETDDAFKLVFRLYDTPLSGAASPVSPVVPSVRREACS